MSTSTEQHDEAASRSTRRSLRELADRWSVLARRQRWGPIVGVGLVALLVGMAIGRATVPSSEEQARRAIEASLLPVALDADAIWTSSSEDGVPIAEGLVALRSAGDPEPVEEHLDTWLEAYDAALIRLAGPDLPPAARPVQRQFITAIGLSRDAVEVLGHAAEVDDEMARTDLTTEVGRLRKRSEQLFQAARASVADLDGQRADVAPPQDLPGFLEGRAG